MSRPPESRGAPITSKQQLVDYLAAAVTPREDWLIGTEHEKFAFHAETHRRLPYDGETSIRALLEGFTRFGWEPIVEDGKVIALSRDGCAITLEPGGQFELSGAPLETLHQTCDEAYTHLHEVKQVAETMNAKLVGLGFDPEWRRADVGWMPKGRYGIMARYMPTKGDLGLDMMLRTSTIQVNLDFESEADMVEKFRIGIALQPIATALFANSPFYEGKPSGFLSFRSQVWNDTDPDRCGILPFVFEDGMGFERYVDYLLDVPMYFLYRDGVYHDFAGKSFRKYIAGDLPEAEGFVPDMGDWTDHMTTVFPEVRLKQYLEMRGADGGPWGRICALPALWVGLLYDKDAQTAAWDLCKDWTLADHEYLRAEVPRQGLKTPFRDGTVQDLARETLAIAEKGLTARARVSPKSGILETHYLEPLKEIAASGVTPAERLLEAYETRWNRSVGPIWDEEAY